MCWTPEQCTGWPSSPPGVMVLAKPPNDCVFVSCVKNTYQSMCIGLLHGIRNDELRQVQILARTLHIDGGSKGLRLVDTISVNIRTCQRVGTFAEPIRLESDLTAIMCNFIATVHFGNCSMQEEKSMYSIPH